MSTSGNSENLLAAFAKAKELGCLTIGLAGHDGGTMAASAGLDHCLVVASDSIHRMQETHVAIYHILWDLVHTLLADDRGGLAADAAAMKYVDEFRDPEKARALAAKSARWCRAFRSAQTAAAANHGGVRRAHAHDFPLRHPANVAR